MITFFDLFAGIGSFRLALERLSFQCVGACENDEYRRTIYAKHWEEPKFGDVTKVDATDFPYADVYCAGFPCQAFSVAGYQLGFLDTRGTLFFDIARIAKAKRPRVLLLENVRGLLSHDKGKTFTTILNTLDELGYDAEWQVFNCKDFLPQTRQRVFIIGHLREKPFKQIFPIIGQTTTIQKLHKGERFTARCLFSNMWRLATPEGYFKRKVNNVIFHRQGEDILSRQLTPVECERLQGFPDNWTDGVSDSQRYKMLGDTIPVPMVEFIGTYLKQVL